MTNRPAPPPRLIDLHVDWSLQYAGENTLFHAESYPRVKARLPQSEGYLGATRAAVLACYRAADDWARQADPWHALGGQIAQLESEFCGRLLKTDADLELWESEPEALCWGVLGVEGFDALIRGPEDLDRLPGLFRRGVRVFQPVYNQTGLLAGSSAEGDDRGLTDLGRDFLRALLDLAPAGPGPRPVVDLAHLNPRACGEVLDWFEADEARPRRLPLVYSHGAPAHDGFDHPRALAIENLVRLRALGGTVGLGVTPPFFDSPGRLKEVVETLAEIPWKGQAGWAGLAIGTDFLGVDSTLPGLANSEQVAAWVARSFETDQAGALLFGNARALIGRACGQP